VSATFRHSGASSSAFRAARRLHQEIFRRFPASRDYIEETKSAKERLGCCSGAVPLPGHHSLEHQFAPSRRRHQRAPAGSAADIIRRAMVRIEPALKAKLSAQMLLQCTTS
jgi:DNA polymerase-1